MRRQGYVDMQLAATMLHHKVPTIVTENAAGFLPITGLNVVNPFAESA